MRYMTEEEQREFWGRHIASRRALDKRFGELPLTKKLEILEEMRANHEAVYNAKKLDCYFNKGGMMEVIYDKETQAVYIKFKDVSAGEIDYSEELSDTILIDKTKSGEIVGIDILEIGSIELFGNRKEEAMDLAIIKKVEGRWIVDRDSEHIFEGEKGVFADGAYQEVEVSKITPIRKHPKDPSK